MFAFVQKVTEISNVLLLYIQNVSSISQNLLLIKGVKVLIPSYDPCFFLNFSRPYEVVFNLQCKVIDEFGLGSMKTEQAGYAYRDVVVEAKPYQPFNYVS
jgi:hypothetical protein